MSVRLESNTSYNGIYRKAKLLVKKAKLPPPKKHLSNPTVSHTQALEGSAAVGVSSLSHTVCSTVSTNLLGRWFIILKPVLVHLVILMNN